MAIHKIHNFDGVVIAEVEHDGTFELPLHEAFEMNFDEDYEPCSLEGDQFIAGFLGKDDHSYVYVVKHKNGDSESFRTIFDMMQSQAQIYHRYAS
jgi:hypothetical protein